MDYYQRSSTADLVICPYDKTHVIRKERLSHHIIKCGKTAICKNVTSCEYNFCHKIKRGEGVEHYSKCERKHAEDERIKNGKTCVQKGDTSLPKYSELHIEGEN